MVIIGKMVDDREGTLSVSGFVWDLTGVRGRLGVDGIESGVTVTGSHFPEAEDHHGIDSSSSDTGGIVNMSDSEDVRLVRPRNSDAKVDIEEGRDDDL